MADQQIPQAWVGQDVIVFGPAQHPIYAHLEGIGEFGLVLRHEAYIAWGERTFSGDPEHSEYRAVSHFYPWHGISSFRLQEEDEKRTEGLE